MSNKSEHEILKLNILHYALGFPPYRTGGLTKFCMDLMNEQSKEGHNVSLLWPGRMISIHRDTYIKKHKSYGNIDNYEVYNPTPISYDEGIVDIELFLNTGNKQVYLKLLADLKIDVLHVHTLMGLHKGLLEAAKELCIKIVFTAHDFFPICPKVTMYRNGKICDCIESCEKCAECNLTALSISKIKVLQSLTYRVLKESFIVKKIRKNHRDSYLSEEIAADVDIKKIVRSKEDYSTLRRFYSSLLEYMDVIHYNSTVTKQIYERYLKLEKPRPEVISISHSNIKDNRKIKCFDRKSDNELRITYLGPAGGAKGYFVLKEALDILWQEIENGDKFDWNTFSLQLFFEPREMSPYMKKGDRYSYEQLDEIFDKTDVLIVPSMWYETFGYTVLEAISFGVPVMISETVGAKDILKDGTGIIIENINSDKIADTIKFLTKEECKKMNENILCLEHIDTITDMSNEILEKCYDIR